MPVNKPAEGEVTLSSPEETAAVPVEAATVETPSEENPHSELSAEEIIAQIKAEDERLRQEGIAATQRAKQEKLQREQAEFESALEAIKNLEGQKAEIEEEIKKHDHVERVTFAMKFELQKQIDRDTVPHGEETTVGPRIQWFDKTMAEHRTERMKFQQQLSALEKEINKLRENPLVQRHERDINEKKRQEESVKEAERIAAEKAEKKAEFEAKVEAFETAYAEAKVEIDKAAKNWVDFWKADNGWALRLNSEGASGLVKEMAPLYKERKEINEKYPNAANELESIKDSWFKGSRRAELQKAIERMSMLTGQIEKMDKIRIETEENESKLGKLLNSKLHEIEEKCRPFTMDENEISRMFSKKIRQDLPFYLGEDYFHNYGDIFRAYGYDRAEALKGK